MKESLAVRPGDGSDDGSLLAMKLKAVILQRCCKLSRRNGAKPRIIDAHTETATIGSSTAETPGGSGSPSSRIDSITI